MPFTWSDCLESWRAALHAGGLDPDHLVADRPLLRHTDDPAAHERPAGSPDFDWWPRDPDVQFRRHVRLQTHYLRHPGTLGPLPSARAGYRAGGQGAILTAARLHGAQEDGDPAAACQALLAASLHCPARRPAHVPRASDEMLPALQALRELDPDHGLFDYHHLATATLPWAPGTPMDANHDRLAHLLARSAPDMAALARTVIADQVAILRAFQPVRLCFEGRADPDVWAAATGAFDQREAKAERHRDRRHSERLERDARPKSNADAAARAWRDLDAARLKELVWSKPTMEIAKEHGVSDVAVTKRCTALGVAKPPRGFWARVNAGHRPHPQGQPPADLD